jgi:hypothetical protein
MAYDHFANLLYNDRPDPRLLESFCNKFIFYGEELLAPRPTYKMEDHHLSAVRDCLFNIRSYPTYLEGLSSIRNLRTSQDQDVRGWTILKCVLLET